MALVLARVSNGVGARFQRVPASPKTSLIDKTNLNQLHVRNIHRKPVNQPITHFSTNLTDLACALAQATNCALKNTLSGSQSAY